MPTGSRLIDFGVDEKRADEIEQYLAKHGCWTVRRKIEEPPHYCLAIEYLGMYACMDR